MEQSVSWETDRRCIGLTADNTLLLQYDASSSDLKFSRHSSTLIFKGQHYLEEFL
jgi:hypothetical protein